MREKIFCGLDIGTHKIKASLIQTKKGGALNLLGVYELKTAGIKGSSVTNLGELSECIGRTINGLIEKTGVKIKEMYLGIGGNLIDVRYSKAVIPLVDRGSKIITKKDIRKVEKQARLLGFKLEEEVLHDFSQSYRVDDDNIALNPLGLYGRKLEVTLMLVLAEVNRLKNFMKAVNLAGYEVSDLVCTSYAGAQISLSSKMKKDGCLLVDIGANGMNILIFKDGFLRYFKHSNVGGNCITKSIADKFGISFDLAEEIKKSYAVMVHGPVDEEEEILVKRDAEYFPIKRKEICEAMEQEACQQVNNICEAIEESELDGHLLGGIIMMGGGALLPGLIECVEKKTNLTTKMGTVEITNKVLNSAAIFSSAIGLAYTDVQKKGGFLFSSQANASLTKRVLVYVREFYQEYF